jgi:hypothetical protein
VEYVTSKKTTRFQPVQRPAPGWTARVRFPTGITDICLLHISEPALDSTQRLIQWVPGAFSPGVKRPWREAEHSYRPSTEVKNGGAVLPLPDTS